MQDKTSKIHGSVAKAIETEVMLALNRAGGVITDVRRQGQLSTSIGASLPARNVSTFAAWLGDFSQGQGRVSEDTQ